MLILKGKGDNIYHLYKGIAIDVNMSKSTDDVMGDPIFLDLKNVGFCFLIMYIYTTFMLNGSNFSDMRFFLTGIGLLSVLPGAAIAIGLTSAIRFPHMPHFSMLPFLIF